MRVRDESLWDFEHHASVDAFLAQPRTEGAHAITIGDDIIDVLIIDRGSPTTVVVFHGNLPERYETYPVFQGTAFTDEAGTNLICVADPSIAYGDLHLGWYLGTQRLGPLRPLVSPLIHHALASLGTTTTILFGSSAGGYAAGHFAQDFPGCIALLVNPWLTLDITEVPSMAHYLSDYERYWERCHGANPRELSAEYQATFGPPDLHSLATAGLNHDVLIYHNLLDETFLSSQLIPYLRHTLNADRVHVRFHTQRVGHVPISLPIRQEILAALTGGSSRAEAIAAAGFRPPAEALLTALELYPHDKLRRLATVKKKLTEANERLTHKRGLLTASKARIKELQRELAAAKKPPWRQWLLLNPLARKIPRRVRRPRTEVPMSCQAYLDAIETKTGLTPRQLIEIAEKRGYDVPDVQASTILEWLKTDYDLGRGHGMALVHVIKNGPTIDSTQAGSTESHRDESERLWLDGKATKPE